MKRLIVLFVLLSIVIGIVVSACSDSSVGTAITTPPLTRPAENISKAVEYLRFKYNSDLQLLSESHPPGQWTFDPSQQDEWAVPPPWPEPRSYTMDKVYWLGDNALAALALQPYDLVMAQSIQQNISSGAYAGYASSDLPDILFGGRIDNPPPRIQKKVYIEDGNDKYIVIGSQRTDSRLEPISDYADILLLYFIQEWRSGNKQQARQYLQQVLDMWDGIAIWDKVAKYYNEAATYKLALLLITLQVFDEPFDHYKDIEARIWANQDPVTGGIHTGIKYDGSVSGGFNTETTALVLLIYDRQLIDTLRLTRG